MSDRPLVETTTAYAGSICSGCGGYTAEGEPTGGQPVKQFVLRVGKSMGQSVTYCQACTEQVAQALLSAWSEGKQSTDKDLCHQWMKECGFKIGTYYIDIEGRKGGEQELSIHVYDDNTPERKEELAAQLEKRFSVQLGKDKYGVVQSIFIYMPGKTWYGMIYEKGVQYWEYDQERIDEIKKRVEREMEQKTKWTIASVQQTAADQ